MQATSIFLGCLVSMVLAGQEQDPAAESDFGRAYYLEVEEQNPAAAAEFYERVIQREGAPAELVEKARKRLRACREDLRSQDLASLMPPDVVTYLEVRNPGKHVARLLELAGLTGKEGTSEAASLGDPPLPLVISPRLLRGLEKAWGAAVSVTAIDPHLGIPSGVVVIKPGRSDVALGLIETGLSSAVASGIMMRSDPVHGYEAYLGPFVSVVLTERLIVLGNPPRLVSDAVRRLQGEPGESLARSEVFSELKKKRENALLFAFVNAKPLVTLAKAQMQRHGRLPDEYRWAQAITDVESLRWAAVTLGTFDQGIYGDVWMRLDEDNHAMAYHLLRTAHVGRQALTAVPSGVAGFLAFGLSEDGSGEAPSREARSRAARYVTGLDVGREIFANVKDVLAFVLPPAASDPESRRHGMPGIGLVLTVKDPSRSEALWNEILSIPATLIQAEPDPVTTERIDDQEVQVYAYPGSQRIYLATLADRVILASSSTVMSSALRAARGRDSVLDDEAFAKAAAEIPEDVSKIAMVHAGRAFETASAFRGFRISDAEARMIAPLLAGNAITLLTEETPSRLKVSFVASLPKFGGLLKQIFVRRQAFQRPTASRRAFARAPALQLPQVPGQFRDARRLEKIIATGSEWKYSDHGGDPGTSWRQPDHEDSRWRTGRAPLGYGDEHVTTTIGFGNDEENKHPSAYFRKTFTVDDPGRFTSLLIRLRRDDGAAVFINGAEVVRDNLPDQAGYDTFSPETAAGAVETHYFPFVLEPDVLRDGANTVAVEVHQANGSSSDLGFDLELVGRLKDG